MKKESAHIGYCQEFHGTAESKHNYDKENTYSSTQRKIIIRNIFKHLKQLEKPKIGVRKRVVLENFRSFVFPEDQYYWMYRDPSSEDIKLAKKTSLKKVNMEICISKIQ